MAGVDVNNGLREALIENLNNILSPQADVRRAAEEQIHVLEVTEEFGVHLVELTLDRNGPLPIRQLASVLLKQYVEAHWCQDSDKFRLPECPEYAKAKIRELLPHGLHEPISKVRSSVAYAISAIAHWDWPEQWCGLFDLLMVALKSGEEAPVHGAMRVLTEFSRDLTDQHIPQVAPVILPEMYRIFCEEEKYGIRTRGRAVEIFSTLANLICMMGEYNRNLAKTLLYPTLPAFTQALIKGLQTPDGFTSDSGLKKEILSALTILMKNVPKQMGQYLGEVLGPVWQTLTTSADTYVNTTVNAREDADDPVDSDGEVLGFENLVFTIFEFVHALVETSKHKQMIKQGIADLIYYILLYMQITEDQIETWSNNPDAFVEDEDEDSFAYSVRISAQDLLLALCQELAEECGQGLIIAVGRHLERAANQRSSGDPAWWKTHEAVMLALGSVRDLVLDQVAKGQLQFDLTNFIQSVPDLTAEGRFQYQTLSTMADPEKAAVPTNEEEMSEEEMEEDDEEGGGRKQLVDKLMKDPQVLAALQTKLRRFLGTPSGYISSLPVVVKKRIKALKKIQLQYTELEADFYKEVHALEVKYDKMHQELYEKRKKIVNSEYEPNEEECDFPSDDEEEKDLSKDMEEKAKIEDKEESKVHDFDENTKGIPEFWLTIFKNVDLLAEMVQDYDEPILKHLTDIQLKFHDDPMGFTLEFMFSENEYFTNKTLTKYYEMKCAPDKDDPFSFEGPEIFKCKGCTIDWKKGKNVTVKTIKKKQKHKSRGAVRTITKTVQNDSFFNFFNPPPVPEDPSEEMDEDTQALLTADFEIGHYIRERIVPRAVLFYTGEALDDEDFEEEEGEEGDEGEDEEEEDDPDYDPTKDKSNKDQQPAECKQQ